MLAVSPPVQDRVCACTQVLEALARGAGPHVPRLSASELGALAGSLAALGCEEPPEQFSRPFLQAVRQRCAGAKGGGGRGGQPHRDTTL